MAGAAAAAVASGISTRPATPSRALIGRRARSVVRAVVTVERGEKAYTVQKSEEIFNAAKKRETGRKVESAIHRRCRIVQEERVEILLQQSRDYTSELTTHTGSHK